MFPKNIGNELKIRFGVMKMNEARKKADLKFKKKMMKQVNLMLHREKESDIIEFLDGVPNKREYLINLIRSDMMK